LKKEIETNTNGTEERKEVKVIKMGEMVEKTGGLKKLQEDF
jgi:hypothetical protein